MPVENGGPKFEEKVKRNPHPDFKKVEASRPPFDESSEFHYTKTTNPDWKVGDGATSDEWKKHKKIQIDPFGEGRNPVDNYKLLISGIVPRPIGFVSTVSTDGVQNLAPFSFFNVVNSNPPIFCIGFSGGNAKDSCKNVLETGELTINIISEWFAEAANYCSIDTPPEYDEWKLAGLTPAESAQVKPPHVAESAFSIEAKLLHHHEWHSKESKDKKTGVLCIVEGVNFHVREDVINEDLNILDPVKLRPVARLGGISYGRTTQGFELLRPDFTKEAQKEEFKKLE